ncbi:FliH/SctL family protein [Arcobacter sp. FWKO B]|uniref:FliH/SctL family protein n=1 Tax=Arcobacter sp. FWKO B TaxID=2593672 RepID=UPI0018A4BD21|nr:FliH/SctL family protein [Arcobacter sp. FWKO B]QOG12021.1 flagellar assembly protein FliH [Arcobacter sp. FWKO B]
MALNNVSTGAKIVKKQAEDSIVPYQLGTFIGGNNNSNENQNIGNSNVVLQSQQDSNAQAQTSAEISQILAQLNGIQSKLNAIEANGVGTKELDKQVVNAIKELKQYASFFEQATFALESKILKTSLSIAKKIISIEVGENSSKIAKETITNILSKLKSASKVTIHLNPKDYVVLKSELQLQPFILLNEDPNVTAGGVVIASDLGNFDGNIEAKISSMVESLESII